MNPGPEAARRGGLAKKRAGSSARVAAINSNPFLSAVPKNGHNSSIDVSAIRERKPSRNIVRKVTPYGQRIEFLSGWQTENERGNEALMKQAPRFNIARNPHELILKGSARPARMMPNK
jgi:hypothetical protein